MAWLRRRRWHAQARWLAGLALLATVALGQPSSGWGQAPTPQGAAERRPLRVRFVDVGQGDAIFITSPAGKTVLVDGGPRAAGRALTELVRSQTAAPIDLVLLTHRHADHLGGLAAVIRERGARLFMDAAFPHPSSAYAALIRVLEERRIPVREATTGRTIDLGGGARLILLAPPQPAIGGTRSDVNSNSVVARLEHGEVRMLLTGDAESATEAWLLASGADLRASVLKLAHHGSRYASSPRFLRAVGPRIAVASCGGGNAYGHPHQATLDRLQRAGVTVYRTDRDGTITVSSDGRAVTVETEAEAEAEAEATRAAPAAAPAWSGP